MDNNNNNNDQKLSARYTTVHHIETVYGCFNVKVLGEPQKVNIQ
jgi:hypothetical protein